MASIPRPKISKIPGGGMPVAKPEIHTKDLSQLPLHELLEIKDRQTDLLASKSKLNRLPDKGQRIQDLYDKIEQELQRRSHVDAAAAMFSELNIADTGQKVLDVLEWNRKLNANSHLDPSADVMESDDETEMDPLRLIAQGSMHERKIKELPPEPTLITAEDLEDIKTFHEESYDCSTTPDITEKIKAVDTEIVAIDVVDKLKNIKAKLQKNLQNDKAICRSSCPERNSGDKCQQVADIGSEQHILYIVDKVEADKQPQREKFKPYQTTISHVHDPEKEKLRKKSKHWEVTAATPPPIQHSGTKLLSLLDSVEIQKTYLAKLKELQQKQATERLEAKIERLKDRNGLEKLSSIAALKSSAFTVYRTPTNQIEGDDVYNETSEVLDPLDEERPGCAINYTVYKD